MDFFSRRYSREEFFRIMTDPDPSELPLLLKVSAISWTTRPTCNDWHFISVIHRATSIIKGRPAPGDTKETLLRLLKRATSELAWPELPKGTEKLFLMCFRALSLIAGFGEPAAALAILDRHVNDLENKVVDREYAAKFYVFRLDWLLSAALKAVDEEGK
jgi:hypothetical protein